ncbi:MAG: Mpv17/PMP22 family protein [Prosthecobacter sp.]
MLETIAIVFRRNRVPCLALNSVAVALVVSYYQVPALAGFWEWMGLLKTRWSFAFSCLSTIFAAALLPSFVQWLQGVLPVENRWRRLLLLMLFWGYRGMEIDLFYRMQGWIFGNGTDALTMTKKVILDQFVASPLWFVPSYLIALRWAELGGSWSRTRQTLNREFWTRTCPTVLITNWLVWIPALALVYSLPPALQFPLFSVVMCCFIIIVTVLAGRPNQGSATT